MNDKRVEFPVREAGVALIEFALALPILMMLLIGLIEIGRLTYFTIEVGNAAHAGAQYASLNPNNAADNTAITAAVTQDGQNTISALTVVPQRICGCWNGTTETALTSAQCTSTCVSGHLVSYVQVTVTGSINALFNYAALGLPNAWTVSRTATMRVIQ